MCVIVQKQKLFNYRKNKEKNNKHKKEIMAFHSIIKKFLLKLNRCIIRQAISNHYQHLV